MCDGKFSAPTGRGHSRPAAPLAALLIALAGVTATGCDAAMFQADTPVQKGVSNPMGQAGSESYAQRQRDCRDMPSAHACYQVGLGYELGLNGPVNLPEAKRFYDKACTLDSEPEHCEAAARLDERP